MTRLILLFSLWSALIVQVTSVQVSFASWHITSFDSSTSEARLNAISNVSSRYDVVFIQGAMSFTSPESCQDNPTSMICKLNAKMVRGGVSFESRPNSFDLTQ